MSIVAKVIWILESHPREQLDLDELASITGRSRSYLSRIFPLVTGYSVTKYLRARRLSEAARKLASGAPDILAVALDAGYGSHEAFTRAFRDQFGTTPQAVRLSRSTDAIKLVEPLRMEATNTSTISPPRIEDRAEMRFVGLSETHNMKSPAGIPDQWRRFQPYIGSIDGAVGEAAYGICSAIDAEGRLEYIAAVEVRPGTEAPTGLSVATFEPLRWARFAHEGDVISIRQTIGAAEQWLNENGYRPAETIRGFAEYYGPAFDVRTGTGDIEIWFGLKQ
jgi:AraC-type DNA-binding domain-containing proteins